MLVGLDGYARLTRTVIPYTSNPAKVRLTLVWIFLNVPNRHSSTCLNSRETFKLWQVSNLRALLLARFP